MGRCGLVVAALAAAGCGPDPLPATGTLLEEPFASAVVGDEYLLRIRLPPGYEEGATSLPLVVQLDPTYAGLG